MIFQAGIDLNIEGKNVQAVIDLDTGMIGFTEVSGDECIEHDYFSSPPQYKIEFLRAVEKIASAKLHVNSLICRKGKAAQVMQDHWKNSRTSKS